MVLSTSETSTAYDYVIDDVISKARCDLVYNGELDESVLSQIHSKWKTKMIQAGVISGTIVTCSASIPTPTPLQTPEPNPLPENAQFLKSNPSTDFVMSTNAIYRLTRLSSWFLTCVSDEDVDENEEILNEDDDDEEDATDDDDMNIPDLVLCQFDTVKRRKNKWECNFNVGVMQIHGQNALFSEATGNFNFLKDATRSNYTSLQGIN